MTWSQTQNVSGTGDKVYKYSGLWFFLKSYTYSQAPGNRGLPYKILHFRETGIARCSHIFPIKKIEHELIIYHEEQKAGSMLRDQHPKLTQYSGIHNSVTQVGIPTIVKDSRSCTVSRFTDHTCHSSLSAELRTMLRKERGALRMLDNEHTQDLALGSRFQFVAFVSSPIHREGWDPSPRRQVAGRREQVGTRG